MKKSILQTRVRERLDALDISARKAALDAGLEETFVRQILYGRTKSPRVANLQELSRVLKCDVPYLTGLSDVVRREPSREVIEIPVIGYVEENAYRDVSREIVEKVEVIKDYRFKASDQVAFIVKDNSAIPICLPGGILTGILARKENIISRGVIIIAEERTAEDRLHKFCVATTELDGSKVSAKTPGGRTIAMDDHSISRIWLATSIFHRIEFPVGVSF